LGSNFFLIFYAREGFVIFSSFLDTMASFGCVRERTESCSPPPPKRACPSHLLLSREPDQHCLIIVVVRDMCLGNETLFNLYFDRKTISKKSLEYLKLMQLNSTHEEGVSSEGSLDDDDEKDDPPYTSQTWTDRIQTVVDTTRRHSCLPNRDIYPVRRYVSLYRGDNMFLDLFSLGLLNPRNDGRPSGWPRWKEYGDNHHRLPPVSSHPSYIRTPTFPMNVTSVSYLLAIF
jgi:hypothetical protein